MEPMTNPQPEMEKPESKRDAARWLDGEISLGRFIHNMSLESCYAQASDFAGGIANELNERHEAATAPLREEIERLKETNSGIPHVYKRLMEMSPWTESNDMNWEDEMDCGFDGLHERLVEQENQITKLESELTTKREVLEKCVEELRKQIKHLHSSSAYYQSGQSVLTLANEELKKGQRE